MLERQESGRSVEAERLTAEWRTALAAREANSSDRTDVAEEAAYEALIGYVEEHGLNYTSYDPRPTSTEGETQS